MTRLLETRPSYLLWFSFFTLAILLFANAMMRPIERNENMYLAAASLFPTLSLYRDYSFVQTPYLPVLYGICFELFDIEYRLLVARFISFLFALVAIVVISRTCARLLASQALAASVAILLAFSDLFIQVAGDSSNYIGPLAASLCGYALFIGSGGVIASQRWRLAASGACMGLAVGLKLYYASLALGFLFFALWPGDGNETVRRRWLTVAQPWIIGFVLSLSPVAYYLIRSPDLFLFNNVWFHFATGEWYESIGYHDRLTVFSRLRFGKSWMQHPSQLAILVCLVYVCLMNWRARRGSRAGTETGWRLALCLTVLSTATTLCPKPAWPLYFVMPIPFALLSIATGIARLHPAQQRASITLVVASALVSISVTAPYYSRHVWGATSPGNWTPIETHRQSLALRALISRPDLPVATLSPLYIVEAGLPIYEELAAGPFVYQLADRLSLEQRQAYRVTSPRSIHALLEQRPPGAVLVGIDPSATQLVGGLEQELVEHATRNGFRSEPVDPLGATLYVDPRTQ